MTYPLSTEVPIGPVALKGEVETNAAACIELEGWMQDGGGPWRRLVLVVASLLSLGCRGPVERENRSWCASAGHQAVSVAAAAASQPAKAQTAAGDGLISEAELQLLAKGSGMPPSGQVDLARLVRTLSEGDSDQRFWAAWALKRHDRTGVSGTALLQLLWGASQPGLRQAALFALLEVPAPADLVVPFVLSTVEEAGDRTTSVKVLRKYFGETTRGWFLAASRSDDAVTRELAVNVTWAVACGSPLRREIVTTGLRDVDAVIRRRAISSLVQCPLDARNSELLHSIARDDPDAATREYATEALKYHSDKFAAGARQRAQ
jgi:hypothetical protein